MIRVLFVCLGNICRSPMAEAVFAHKVREAGLADKIAVDSAGTGQWHIGERANPGTLRVLARENIPYDGRARLLVPEDRDRFDYIMTMDAQNLADVQALFGNGTGRAKVAPLLSYAPETDTDDVPDPYYNGKFDLVYELVTRGTDGLLATIRRERGL